MMGALKGGMRSTGSAGADGSTCMHTTSFNLQQFIPHLTLHDGRSEWRDPQHRQGRGRGQHLQDRLVVIPPAKTRLGEISGLGEAQKIDGHLQEIERLWGF